MPKWGYDSIKFAYSNNPDRRIILLLDKNSYSASKVKNYPFEIVYLDNLFIEKCSLSHDNSLSNSFWINTAKRLKVLYEYCKHSNIKQYFHAEIDNLVFSLHSLDKKLNLLGKGFFAPKDSEERALASLVFCNNNESITKILSFFSPPFSAKSEMHAIGQYTISSICSRNLPTESFLEVKGKWLVISPEKTDGIFDAAAIGQFIFGIDPIHEPYNPLYNLFINENVLINFSDLKFYLKNKNVYIYFEKIKKEFKIYNIHIHSKKIKKAIEMINGNEVILRNLNVGKKTLISNRHKIITGKIRFLYTFIRRKIQNLKKVLKSNL